jgi:hypothetical protein
MKRINFKLPEAEWENLIALMNRDGFTNLSEYLRVIVHNHTKEGAYVRKPSEVDEEVAPEVAAYGPDGQAGEAVQADEAVLPSGDDGKGTVRGSEG